MQKEIKGLEDIFEAQARINKKKRSLQRRDDQTAADWLKLAHEYQQIDSRANVAFCQSRAAYLETQTEETKEEWWDQ